jgi:hypothetical protein
MNSILKWKSQNVYGAEDQTNTGSCLKCCIYIHGDHNLDIGWATLRNACRSVACLGKFLWETFKEVTAYTDCYTSQASFLYWL